MNLEKNNTIMTYVGVFSIVITLFTFFNIYSLTIVSVLSLVMPICMITILALVNKWLFIIHKKNIYIFFSLLFFGVLYFLWGLDFRYSLISIQRGFILCVYLIFFIFYFNLALRSQSDKFVNILCTFLIIIIVLVVPNISYFLAVFNPNIVGMYISMLFLLLLLLLKGNFIKILVFIVGSYFILLTEARTSLLAYFAASLFYMFSFFIYRSKFIYYSVFYSLILFSAFIVFITINDKLFLFADYTQRLSTKNIESGRNIIWPLIYDFIKEKPVLGHGGGINLSNLYNTELSAHNLYLQVGVQVGVLGLILLFLFYFFLWKRTFDIYQRYMNMNVKVVGSIFVWILIVQNFEVTLFQNNVALSLPMFAIMAYFLGKSCSK